MLTGSFNMRENLTQGFDNLIAGLSVIAVPVAKDLLRSTVADSPRPPFDTGALRRSGRAYVNGRFVSSTHRMREAQGSNPATRSRKPIQKSYLATGSYSESASGVGADIEIVYKAPYASKMHGWPKERMSDPESGPGFISTKLLKIDTLLQKHLTSVIDLW